MLTLPLTAESLVPHRSPMRLVDQLVEIEGKNGVVEALVDRNCPLVSEEGVLEKVALVELIAQSYAALKGYLDRVENKPVRQGFLVGIKSFVSLLPVYSGETLRITIETLGELEDFAVAEGKIWRSETLVGRGEIKIWIN